MTPLEFATASDQPFQTIGAAHYFHDLTRTAADAINLDLFRFYFCGRGGVLGPVESSVVQAAFGYFNPKLLDKMWTSGSERSDVTEVAAAQMQVSYDIGNLTLEGLDGLAEATEALARVTSTVDPGGLGLFASFQQLPTPEELPAAWMHQCVLMRELRGSVHLAAVTAHGLPGRVAHQIARPDDGEMFGWREPTEVTDDQRDAYALAKTLTDTGVAAHCEALSETERSHIVACAQASAERIT